MKLRESRQSGSDYGFIVKLYSDFHENLTEYNSYISNGKGYFILVENNTYLTDQTDGIQVSPGFVTHISIDRKFESRLPRPYSICTIDDQYNPNEQQSELYNLFLNSEYEYTRQNCFDQCLQKFIITKCNCTYVKYLSLFNNKYCDNKIELECQQIQMNLFEVSSCEFSCPLECNTTTYISSATSYQIIGNYYADYIKENEKLKNDFVTRTLNAESAKDSGIHINVFYDSMSYILSEESPQMDVVSLLANIGGNLGLFLGVSVFSLFEIIQVLIEILFIKIEPRIKPSHL